MAHLQCTCKHLKDLLVQDRLWQFQLEQCFPMWTSAGIYPVSGRQDGQTWKQLVVTASTIPAGRPDTGSIITEENRKQLWNSGKQKRQLARGAKMLAKALELLVDFGKPATGQSQQHLWYNNPELAMSASSAGSYLIDLLHMRVLHLSPLAISAPEAFLQACTGKGSPAVSAQAPDKIEWCGAEYTLEDLKAALAVLLPQGTPGDELMAQHYSDPWQPATWEVYSHNAVTLLKALAECQTAPQDEWQLPGAALLSKAEQMSEVPGELTPSGVCKAHQLFAGATLLLRLYFRQDKGVTVHAEHGLMYEDARQHQRAAYYYKLAIMVGCQNPSSELDYNVDSVLVGIAEAFDGEWQDTGMVQSFQKAFEWRKFLVRRLLGKSDKTPAVCERTCMRQIDANTTIITWLQDHVQMADTAEKAFLAFLEGTDIRSSASSVAARAWAQPPVELTVKHVGFLGSLAHALVHLQKASEGLSLLRAAACIMRTNPPAFHMWFQGSPDPQVLHAHVLMDLGVSLLGERQYEEALDVFMEGLGIATRQRLGERVLSTFHDHVAHTILQLRQQRALHIYTLTSGERIEISWRQAEEHARTAVTAGQSCKPPEPALEASPLTTLGDIASAMCKFPLARQRYMEAYDRLAGDASKRDSLSASNAAEAATTLAAVADMLLKTGQVEEATDSLATSLDLLKQHPGQLPALQVKRTQLYLTTLQMQIHIYRGDLAGAQHQLQTCISLTQKGAEYRPGFIRYDEAVTAAAQGDVRLALQLFRAATAVAVEQQDKQLETMAATAVGLLMTGNSQDLQQEEEGWTFLQRAMSLAVSVGDKLCEAHAAEGMLKVLASDGLGKRFKNKRELKRSLQEQVQVIIRDVGQAAIDASRRMLSFAGL
ncbi:hypothetical protein WJX79_006804 [Trebouxia sp. C0005]